MLMAKREVRNILPRLEKKTLKKTKIGLPGVSFVKFRSHLRWEGDKNRRGGQRMRVKIAGLKRSGAAI